MFIQFGNACRRAIRPAALLVFGWLWQSLPGIVLRPLWCLSLTVAVSRRFSVKSGILFGAVAGLLWDLTGGAPLGTHIALLSGISYLVWSGRRLGSWFPVAVTAAVLAAQGVLTGWQSGSIMTFLPVAAATLLSLPVAGRMIGKKTRWFLPGD